MPAGGKAFGVLCVSTPGVGFNRSHFPHRWRTLFNGKEWIIGVVNQKLQKFPFMKEDSFAL